MATRKASAQDVKDRIDTSLDDGTIETKIDDAVFDLEQETNIDGYTDTERTQIEWRLAAYKIMTTLEKETSQESRNSVSFTFEESTVKRLRDEISSLTDGALPLDDDTERASFEVY